MRRASRKSVLCAVCVSPGASTVVRFCVLVVRPVRGWLVVRAWFEVTAPVPRFCTKVSELPSGSCLSVSRSMSRMFFSMVSQMRWRDVALMVSVELLPPLAELAPEPCTTPEITWVAMPTVSVTSRAMFT